MVFCRESILTPAGAAKKFYVLEDNGIPVSMAGYTRRSFGTATSSKLLHQAVVDAAKHNILIIASAGNGGEVNYPAAYNEVVAVGSLDTNGKVSECSSSGNKLN